MTFLQSLDIINIKKKIFDRIMPFIANLIKRFTLALPLKSSELSKLCQSPGYHQTLHVYMTSCESNCFFTVTVKVKHSVQFILQLF